MARLSDFSGALLESIENLPLPQFESSPWAGASKLSDARVALVSTAGLHRASDDNFLRGSSEYRLIPGDLDYADLRMSHVSANFDRTGFQQDVNVVFPLELLRTLAAEGSIGSVASWHYSFMGATEPERLEDAGAQVGRLLRDDGVTAALLIPV